MSRPGYVVAALAGDGIGPEVMSAARALLDQVSALGGPPVVLRDGLLGAAALDTSGSPFPEATRALVDRADAVLLGAVGDPRYDGHTPSPESALLELRTRLGVYANLRPIRVVRPDLGPLRPEIAEGTDLVFVRELTGGIYFGRPRGRSEVDGRVRAVDTMMYDDEEVERVARVAFELASARRGRLCSVDKANVLECSRLWREVVTRVGRDYPDVELRHLLVDAAAMHLITKPRAFDVVLTSNLFGDILSDEASTLLGSIGLAPSASLGAKQQNGRRAALYEPIHGSAPDIAGQGRANPIGAMSSVAAMLRHSLEAPALAAAVEAAIDHVVVHGPWTADVAPNGHAGVGTHAVTRAVLERLEYEVSNR